VQGGPAIPISKRMQDSQDAVAAPQDSAKGGRLDCFAVVVPGLEQVAAEELMALAVHDVRVIEGGVEFSVSIDALCRVNLRARSITRVLLRLAEFKALSFPELFNKARKIHWQRYIPAGRAVSMRAACRHSKLMHSGRVESCVRDAIAERLEQEGIKLAEGTEGEQQVVVRLEHDVCVISLDSSGERLDRRGYRLLPGHAPIRETVAAAILQWMAWRADEPLLVPMCGSGTFAIEAAQIGRGRAANPDHDFALLHWPLLNTRRWQRARDKAAAMQRDKPLTIRASDADEAILAQARANAEAAGVDDVIRFECLDVRDLRQPEAVKGGLIVCNPPYGDRIKGDAHALYRDLGALFRTYSPAWRMAVIVPDKSCERAMDIPVRRRLKVKHGGLWVHVLHLEGC
jgi:23S rRNA G2445 N2-methylase RlmL